MLRCKPFSWGYQRRPAPLLLVPIPHNSSRPQPEAEPQLSLQVRCTAMAAASLHLLRAHSPFSLQLHGDLGRDAQPVLVTLTLPVSALCGLEM